MDVLGKYLERSQAFEAAANIQLLVSPPDWEAIDAAASWHGSLPRVPWSEHNLRLLLPTVNHVVLAEGSKQVLPGGLVVRILVVDDGPGIAPGDLSRIFSPFARAADEPEKGTGLGLSIVREIVGKHGGSVGCCSTVGVGTAFFIALVSERRVGPLSLSLDRLRGGRAPTHALTMNLRGLARASAT